MSKSLFESTRFKLGCILKITKIELELIPDSDGYANANSKYLKSYDPKQKRKHITYLDTNNLYGHAMSKFLPTIGFKWIDPKEFELNIHTSNSSKRCVLKVDLEYLK